MKRVFLGAVVLAATLVLTSCASTARPVPAASATEEISVDLQGADCATTVDQMTRSAGYDPRLVGELPAREVTATIQGTDPLEALWRLCQVCGYACLVDPRGSGAVIITAAGTA